MSSTIERRLSLQGSYNFRDIGGYVTPNGQVVRWKRLYRSDALHRLTPADLDLLQPIGVATLLDLRSARELEESGPSQLVSSQGATHRHVPFIQNGDELPDLNNLPPMDEIYRSMIDRGAEALRAVFLALAEADTYPAVVHCAAGKDRTGMTVALVLRTLGVSDDDIAFDYSLTYPFLKEHLDRLRAAGAVTPLDNVPADLLQSNPEMILTLLQTIDDRFGSSEQFLLECGVPRDAFAEIRNQLLDRNVPV